MEVGKVVDAWGVKGGIKVAPFSSDPQALFGTKRWFLLPPTTLAPKPVAARPGAAAPSISSSHPRLLRVRTAREQGDVIVATIDGMDDRTAAEAIKGGRIFVSRASFPTPEEDEYYWVDLIGLDVVNLSAQPLGRVVGLLETGPHCVLRCQYDGEDGQSAERLIPFVDAFIRRVSLAERLIEADWGLDY